MLAAAEEVAMLAPPGPASAGCLPDFKKKIYYTTYTELESNVGRAAQGEQRPRPINSRWRGEKRNEEAANEAEGDPRAVTANCDSEVKGAGI